VLRRVQARAAATRESNRAELDPLLTAAGLEATRGHAEAARAGYEQILAVEPDWPRALAGYATFLYDQAVQQKTHGSLAQAVKDATRMLEIAERIPPAAQVSAEDARVLPAALEQMGDVLVLRGQPGDAEKALGHYQRCHEVLERLLAANPESAQAARDVVVSHYKLGQFGQQTGDEALTKKHRSACYAVLHKYVSSGVTFDAPVMELYRELRAEYGGGQK
jgi:tetratricopeptide (TPR) repeat protein